MFSLPNDFAERLAKECHFSAEKGRIAPEPIRKLFFYSAIHSEISRILNWYWDEDLALLHMSLQTLHTNLTARAGVPSFAPLFNHLPDIADELAGYLDSGKDNAKQFSAILRLIARVNYASTPHGSYIAEKGMLKV